MKFPPPPEPPTGGEEFLHSLADYYRSLLEYHQRAATAAAQQFAHLEALLHPERLLDFPTDVPYQLAAEAETEPEPPSPVQLPGAAEAIPEQAEAAEPTVQASQALTLLLEAERGKMLHLDFIVRKLYGRQPEEELASATATVRQLLEAGASQGKWYAVPDSPDCWTLDLHSFPDLGATSPASKSHRPVRKFLPDCEKLDRYGTLKKGIAACLEEHSPESMTIQQIIDWFYAKGVPEAVKHKVYDSMTTALSEGCNRLGWRRVSPGCYVWKGLGK